MYITLSTIVLFLLVVTTGLAIRMIVEKKKGSSDWSVWANLISAAGTFVVGVATIFVMFEENGIQKRLAKMEEDEHQPIFVVEENSFQSEGSEVYDYEEFVIYNRGSLVKEIKDITVDVFIKFDYNTQKNRFESYIPIKDYFYRYYKTGALEGDVAHSYGSFLIQNVLSYNLILEKIPENNNEYIRFELIKIYTIDYVDIYGTSKTIRFKGKSELSDEYYRSIKSISDRDFNGEEYDLKSVSPEFIDITKIRFNTTLNR